MLCRLPWRTFLSAFVLTLCVLGLFCAFFVIECRIQQTTFGRVDLGVTYTIENGTPDVQVDGERVALPVRAPLAAVVPLPAKLFAAVWRCENELAAWMWDRVAAP